MSVKQARYGLIWFNNASCKKLANSDESFLIKIKTLFLANMRDYKKAIGKFFHLSEHKLKFPKEFPKKFPKE